MSTIEIISIIISVVSAIAAIISIAVARRANKTAEKVYAVDLLGQLFDLYRAETMLHSLQLTWKNYRLAWAGIDDDSDRSEKKVNSGVPIPHEVAEKIISSYVGKKEDSQDWAAIHEVTSFWKYIALLVSEEAVDELYISAFTAPEILGFLYPFEEAFCEKKGIQLNPKTSLKSLFEKFQSKGLIHPIR